MAPSGATPTDVRLDRLESDHGEHRTEVRELKQDIRSLTQSVSELAKTVAVLSERLTHLAVTIKMNGVSQQGEETTAPAHAKGTPMGWTALGAAIGGAIAAAVAKLLGVPN